jgi:hypothetical protein
LYCAQWKCAVFTNCCKARSFTHETSIKVVAAILGGLNEVNCKKSCKKWWKNVCTGKRRNGKIDHQNLVWNKTSNCVWPQSAILPCAKIMGHRTHNKTFIKPYRVIIPTIEWLTNLGRNS